MADTSDQQAEMIAARLAELLNNNGDVHVIDPDAAKFLELFAKSFIDNPDAAKTIIDNPKALAAWVWIYETWSRVRLLGVSLTGLLKWSLIFVGTIIAIKQGFVTWIAQAIKGMPK